jgi:BCD family chlorophyll transporter-like MFS transporter
MMSKNHEGPAFSVWHTIRLSSFQLGSAMGDILVTSIWNRVMITNFGIPAAPVGLLIGLRYLLAPLSLWAGFLSDTRSLWGMRRTAYIWLGRGLMLTSLPLLGVSLGRLEGIQTDLLGWLCAISSSMLYGIGTLISGSPYLALVRDSAPEERQGFAISMVETTLIIFFALAGIAFSFWMKVYDQAVFWQMVIATVAIGGFFWFFAVANAEKRIADAARLQSKKPLAVDSFGNPGFRGTLVQIWSDPRMRGFFFFLSLATLSAWAQDAILEPFGAEVFQLPIERTTRLNSYWQGATVITLIASVYKWRKRPPELQRNIANGGLIVMALGMLLLGVTSLGDQARLLELSLFVFGSGFGVYTFGGVSLMAVMASKREAGAYLGLWSVSILVSKGLGTFLGGALRDLLLLHIEWAAALSYGVIFILEALGLIGAVVILARLDVLSVAQETGRTISRSEAQIANAD